MREKFTELTDSQWQFIEKIIADKRQRWHNLRTITNAILSIVWTGVQWRSLDSKYPPWQSVYYYFNKWAKTGVFEQILDELVVKERQRQHKENTPSLLAIDSQSVKKMTFISQDTGIDGGKFVNGRKRHIFVDTLGLPWAISVTAANISDSEAGCHLSDQLRGKVPRLKVITADKGYKTTFIEYIKVNYKWVVEIPPQRRTAKTRIN